MFRRSIVARAAVECALLLSGLGFGLSGAEAHPGIDEQLAEVNALLAADPGRVDLLLRRGELHRQHGEPEAAEADYRKARDLDPRLVEVDLWIAELRLEGGKPDEAKQLLDALLAARPDHIGARVARARASARLGSPLEAAADYSAAIEGAGDAPSGPDWFLERAHVLIAAGEAHYAEALRGLDEGLARLGRPIALEVEAIDLELRLRRWDAALARIEALSARPGRPETWLLRKAEVLEAAGRPDAALESYRRGLSAIEALDAGRRASRSSQTLESSARAAIARLSGPGREG